MALFRKKTEEEISEAKVKKEAHRAEIEAKVEARFPGIKKPVKPLPREEIESKKFVEKDAAVVVRVTHVYKIGGKNLTVSGQVTKGTLLLEDEVYVASDFMTIDKSVVTDIAQFNKHYKAAAEGSLIQITLDAPNVNVARGDVLFVEDDDE